jgi:hypothetical protein
MTPAQALRMVVSGSVRLEATDAIRDALREALQIVEAVGPLPSPIGETQTGAPPGYVYGDALQDIVSICRVATHEQAVAFLRARLRKEYLTGALEAGPAPVHQLFGLCETGRTRSDVPNLTAEGYRATREADWQAGFGEGQLAAQGHEHDTNPHRKAR